MKHANYGNTQLNNKSLIVGRSLYKHGSDLSSITNKIRYTVAVSFRQQQRECYANNNNT